MYENKENTPVDGDEVDLWDSQARSKHSLHFQATLSWAYRYHEMLCAQDEYYDHAEERRFQLSRDLDLHLCMVAAQLIRLVNVIVAAAGAQEVHLANAIDAEHIHLASVVVAAKEMRFADMVAAAQKAHSAIVVVAEQAHFVNVVVVAHQIDFVNAVVAAQRVRLVNVVAAAQ